MNKYLASKISYSRKNLTPFKSPTSNNTIKYMQNTHTYISSMAISSNGQPSSTTTILTHSYPTFLALIPTVTVPDSNNSININIYIDQ